MPPLSEPLDRRTFLADLGRGAFAVAIFTVAGCGPNAIASRVPSPSPRSSAGPGPTPTGPGGTDDSSATAPPPPGSPPPRGVSWERVNLGGVSAYLVVRGGEAALVDTGVAGSADSIEASLTGLGLDWSAVGHVVLTHHHNDHAGSIRTVSNSAPAAGLYAGAEDIDTIAFEKPITAVGDGELVFDLQIVTAPGHTAGSICVYDPISGVLVAGDALRTEDGRPVLPGSQFTEDMAQARQSVVKLGALSFETLLVGHGSPIEGGASALVAELGAAG